MAAVESVTPGRMRPGQKTMAGTRWPAFVDFGLMGTEGALNLLLTTAGRLRQFHRRVLLGTARHEQKVLIRP